MFKKLFLAKKREAQPEYGMVIENSCTECKHFDRGAIKCAAFPTGIPVRILMGADPHIEPYPGDHGIQFTPFDKPD